MSNEFDDIEQEEIRGMTFDFRGFLFKALNLWKLVLLSIGGALIIAYFINVRKQNVYRIDSLVSIENGILVKIQLEGACVGCSVNQMTLKSGVEMTIKKYAPQIEEVVNLS